GYVFATAAAGDFAGADGLEEFADLAKHVHGLGVYAGAEAAGGLGPPAPFAGGPLVLDPAADKRAVGQAAASSVLFVYPKRHAKRAPRLEAELVNQRQRLQAGHDGC